MTYPYGQQQPEPYPAHQGNYGPQGGYQPPPPPAPPVPPVKPPRAWWKRKRVLIPTAVLALFVIIGISGGGKKPATATPTAQTATTTNATPAVAAPAKAAPVQAPAPAPAPAGPATSFGNGTYIVGEDIAPGKYRSPAPSAGIVSMCYFDVKNDAGAYLDQGVANEGPSRVTLSKKGTTFTSSGCEDWVKTG